MNDFKILVGYDTKGVVYDTGEHIIRKIVPDYIDELNVIFDKYKEHEIKKYGFVKTEFIYSEYFKERVLKHKKHTISYPYEWTANMYKDAVLFHLNLFIKLDKIDFTLKDALPNNIVFDGCQPVFIDFLSLCQKNALKTEEWLVEDKFYHDFRHAVLDKMFIPYMLMPLIFMADKRYQLARIFLSEKACNCEGGGTNWSDLHPYYGENIFKRKIFRPLLYAFKRLLGFPVENRFSLYTQIIRLVEQKEKYDFVEFIGKLIHFIDNINITPPQKWLPFLL